jgi:excisionase family DNA binding protein
MPTAEIPAENDRLLTLAEVGDELKVSIRGIRYLIYTNQLQAVRMGKRRLRITRAALNTFRIEQIQAI